MAVALRWMAVVVLVACATPADATYHNFRIEQIYSNADGKVQFIVLRECCNAHGESVWAGQTLRVTDPKRANEKTFTFPGDLPSAETGQKFVLVATKGYAALKIVTPDFIIPDNFLPVKGGTLSYAGVHQIRFDAIPTDGTRALSPHTGIVNNVATNFAGDFGSILEKAATRPASSPVR